jgi:hypothetical protein
METGSSIVEHRRASSVIGMDANEYARITSAERKYIEEGMW